MLLRYPITSYGSHHVELTGGLLQKFEDFIITKVETYLAKQRLMNELQGLDDRCLAEVGIARSQIPALVNQGIPPRD